MCTLSLPPFSLTSFPLLWQAALSAALEGDEEEVTFATADSLPQAGPYVQVTKSLINYSVLFGFYTVYYRWVCTWYSLREYYASPSSHSQH